MRCAVFLSGNGPLDTKGCVRLEEVSDRWKGLNVLQHTTGLRFLCKSIDRLGGERDRIDGFIATEWRFFSSSVK